MARLKKKPGASPSGSPNQSPQSSPQHSPASSPRRGSIASSPRRGSVVRGGGVLVLGQIGRLKPLLYHNFGGVGLVLNYLTVCFRRHLRPRRESTSDQALLLNKDKAAALLLMGKSVWSQEVTPQLPSGRKTAQSARGANPICDWDQPELSAIATPQHSWRACDELPGSYIKRDAGGIRKRGESETGC